MSDTPTCRACRGSLGRPWRAQERQFGQPGDFEYAECVECGALTLINPPDDLSPYYAQGYYSFSGKLPELSRRQRFLGFSVGNLTSSLASIPSRDSRVLDVGCGGGQLVRALKERGYERVEGIDPFMSAETAGATDVSLRQMRVSDVEGKYDVILYHHVLEHVFDPETELRAAARCLADEGRIVVRVPLSDSWAWNHYRTDWFQLDAPRHLWIPSRRAIELIASKNGLRIDTLTEDSTIAPLWLSRLLRKHRTLNGVPMPQYRGREFLLGLPGFLRDHVRLFWLKRFHLGDQASFILRRNTG